jgi:anti-anti-sigma factor
VSTSADLDFERRELAVVATLSGEVDMTNAEYVRDEITGQVPNDAHALVIDLSGTQYLDSAAIELLFELSRRLGRRRQQLRLVVPEESPLTRLLTLTDVGSVAPVHSDLAGALAES